MTRKLLSTDDRFTFELLAWSDATSAPGWCFCSHKKVLVEKLAEVFHEIRSLCLYIFTFLTGISQSMPQVSEGYRFVVVSITDFNHNFVVLCFITNLSQI